MPTFDLRLGDCLEVMRELPDNSVDAVVTDPPYFRVKSVEWDRVWGDTSGFIGWLESVAIEWRRVLRPNGSLICFASPRMAARVEVMLGSLFEVLNHIVWDKPGSRAEGSSKEALRSFFPASERIIFCEQLGADSTALGASGYQAKCDEARGFVFEPLRSYIAGEWERAGLTAADANKATGTQMAGHYLTRSQWALPTEERYQQLREYANRNGGEYLRKDYEYLRKDYEELRKDYEELRKDYEELRRPFNASKDRPYTDVWTYKTVQHYAGKHICEKPLPLMEHIIRTITRSGAVVLDCFCGSGTTGEACVRHGRDFIGIDSDEKWVRMAEARIGAAARQERLAI